MSKFSLELEEDFDFLMIGICSHIKDYRLCWEINRDFEIALKKEEDLEIISKGESRSFSFNTFENEFNQNDIYLIGNKSEMGFLIPEEKNCDYFLIIKGPVQEKEEAEWLSQLNSNKNILTCYKIDPNSLKSKDNLIF